MPNTKNPKRSEYLRKTSNLDRRLDVDMKLGSWYEKEFTNAVKNRKYGVAAISSPFALAGAASKRLAASISNKRSRKRNKVKK